MRAQIEQMCLSWLLYRAEEKPSPRFRLSCATWSTAGRRRLASSVNIIPLLTGDGQGVIVITL